MKKIFMLTALVCSAAIGSNIYAQQAPAPAPPPATGDKNLQDTNLRTRSIDLERVDRDSRKTDSSQPNSAVTAEDRLAIKYAEIKSDYEQIQLSQDGVIKAYQSGSKVDYAQISKHAMEINSSAIRLNSNLFPAIIVENANAKKEEPRKDTTEKETKSTKSVRDLIVELDNTIGGFATSPMFQNLRTVDPKVAEKAKLDLEKIMELSAMLGAEAQKTSAPVK